MKLDALTDPPDNPPHPDPISEDELYRIYEAHRKQGASHEDALKAVELAQGGGQPLDADPATAEAMQRLSASKDSPGVGALKDTGMMAMNGLLLNTPEFMSADWKQRSQDLRKLAPGASAAAEIAGGAIAPVAMGGRAMVAGKGIAGGLVRGALTGGATGAAMGEVSGMADANGTLGERAKEALPGAVLGGALGAGAGAAPVLINGLRRLGGPEGPRVARVLRGTTGIADDIQAARNSAKALKDAAGDAYPALHAANPAVKDPAVLKLLADPRYEEAVSRVEPAGFGLTMQGQGGKFQKGNIPSAAQLREIRDSLKGLLGKAYKGGDSFVVDRLDPLYKELDHAVENAVPGLAEADRAYAGAKGRVKGLEQGFKMPVNKAGSDLASNLENALPENVEGVRTGLVNRMATDAERGTGWLKRLMSGDEDTQAILRQLFPDEPDANKAYAKLLQKIGQERSAAGVGKAAPLGTLGLGGGGLYGMLKLRQKL